MKYDVVKKDLAKELIVCASIVAFMAVIYFVKLGFEESLTSDLRTIQNKNNSITRQIKEVQSSYEKLSRAYETYKNIKKKDLPTISGYNTLASRIRTSRPIILGLADKYNLSDFNVVISPPEIENIDNLDKYEIITNQIDIKFNGASDELIFSMAKEIESSIPGYVELEEISLKKVNELSVEFIDKLRNNNGSSKMNLRYPITGSMSLTWRAIKGDEITFENKKDSNIKQ